MLTLENVQQLFTEHQVAERDPEALDQDLDRVVFAIAQRRAEVLQREPHLVDGVFAAWAICIPFMPQPASYTRLMQERRAEWFGDGSPEQREALAGAYFTEPLLRLELHELGNLVAADDSVERIAEYLGSREDSRDYSDTKLEIGEALSAETSDETRGEVA